MNRAALKAVAAALEPHEIDAAVTVALKITDDSCKMDDEGRALFMGLYDALECPASTLFEATVHDLIAIGRSDPTAFVFGEIRSLRTMAMEAITQPRMKAFKARVRAVYAAACAISNTQGTL